MPETGAAVAAWWGSYGTAATAVAGAASTAYAAHEAMKKPGLPSAPPVLQSPNGAQAADGAMNRARGAAGLGSTNLTGPAGLLDPATTTAKTLLGG